MVTRDLDVVYFVKEAQANEELRYSLRSIEENLSCRRVWIYGGRPAWCKPDSFVKVSQRGATKWDKVKDMFRLAALNDAISEDFILFNDDFFVMSPITEIPPYKRGSLYEHIVKIEMAYGNKPTQYSQLLRKAVSELTAIGASCESYEVHMPMIFNRHKLLEVLGAFPDSHCVRTMYGNYHSVGGLTVPDVKYFIPATPFNEDAPFASTDDRVFATGEAGKAIRKLFNKKCKYERE